MKHPATCRGCHDFTVTDMLGRRVRFEVKTPHATPPLVTIRKPPQVTQASPLSSAHRVDNYRRQTGRIVLTPAQYRRWCKKNKLATLRRVERFENSAS